MTANITEPREDDVSRSAEYTYILGLIKPTTPKIIVDVGALGKKNSNSWNLIKDGWQGVLVEPRPDGARACQAQFEGDFVVVQKAIADYEGRDMLRRFEWNGWATLDKNPRSAQNRLIQSQTPLKEPPKEKSPIEVEVTTLPKLLEECGIPHQFGVLSVDTEGFDEKVLVPMLASPWRPYIILVEDCDKKLLSDAGYILRHEQVDQKVWVQETTS